MRKDTCRYVTEQTLLLFSCDTCATPLQVRIGITQNVSKLMLSMHPHVKGSSVVIRLHALVFQPMLCPAAGSSAWCLVEAGVCVVCFQGVLCAYPVQRGGSRGFLRIMSGSVCMWLPARSDLSLQEVLREEFRCKQSKESH